MSSTGKILQILGLFNDTRKHVRVEDVSRLLEVSPATAYRYVADLAAATLLERASGGRYVLGAAIVELDRQVRMHDPLLAVSQDIMATLSERTGGTALLCRLHGRKVVCVHQVPGRLSPPTVSFERGRAMPIFRGATSRVILAHMPANAIRAIVDAEAPLLQAAGLPTDHAALVERLAAWRAEGTCIAVGEVDPDAMGVAAAIHSGRRLLGSLSVVVAESRAGSHAKRIADQVRRAALRIEGRLADGRRTTP